MFKNETIIINMLTAEGKIKPEQMERAQDYAKIVRKPLLDCLYELKTLNKSEVLHILGEKFSIEVVDLSKRDIPKDVIKLVPVNTARQYGIIPIEETPYGIGIAVSDPLDLDLIDTLRHIIKKPIYGLLALSEHITKAIDKYYGIEEEAVDEMLKTFSDGGISFDDPTGSTPVEEEGDSDAPVIKLVSLIITEAFKNRASDIHIEPMERKLRVRYRIDGVLQEIQGPPKRLQGSVISRIKLMSNMSIAERRLPQDGRIKLKIVNRDIDLRVSTLPSNHGESLVMRILDKSSLLMGMGQLGFMSDDQKRFDSLVRMPNGIILITGPTGSGKTTTLYACLHSINRPDRKIITVEDPVEYQLAGINQVQINEDIGLNFAKVLRSILRQAPNVIMVGEIRDLDTAEIAIHAALTGHLVFSTLHTNDAPGAVTRLIDQGVKPYLVASSVQGILAQRLIRVICKECKDEIKIQESELRSLHLPLDMIHNTKAYRGRGCDKCNGTGYHGRLGIMELLVLDDEIRQMINRKASSTEIRRRAREIGMRTLREDGLLKINAGITTLEEIARVTLTDMG
ncbi:MAG: GspE/PulE family protein [Chlamydiota bacterium]|nr:GspE/PulE family protein [Chlamydiota bacterium]